MPGPSATTEQAETDVAADRELEELWRSLWDEPHRDDIRGKLAHHYESVINNVISSLRQSLRSHWEPGELRAQCWVGLLESIRSFAPGSVVACFPAYAAARVRGAIFDEIRHLDWLPRGMRDDVSRVKETLEQLPQELHGDPSRAQILERAGLSAKRGESVLAAMQSLYFLRLDQEVASRNGGRIPLSDAVPTRDDGPEAKLLRHSEREQVILAMLKLDPRERAILSLHFLGSLTQKQIAKIFNISNTRVCQIESNAIAKLRDLVGDDAGRLAAALVS